MSPVHDIKTNQLGTKNTTKMILLPLFTKNTKILFPRPTYNVKKWLDGICFILYYFIFNISPYHVINYLSTSIMVDCLDVIIYYQSRYTYIIILIYQSSRIFVACTDSIRFLLMFPNKHSFLSIVIYKIKF